MTEVKTDKTVEADNVTEEIMISSDTVALTDKTEELDDENIEVTYKEKEVDN